MSRPRLQAVLEQTLSELERFKDNDILRRGFSNIQTHTLDFAPDKIFNATIESLAKAKPEAIVPTSSEEAQIRSAAQAFASELQRVFKVSGYTATRQAEEKGGKPIDIFRGMTENNAGYSRAKKAYNLQVAQILNLDKPMSLADAGHSLGYGVAENALLFALGKNLHSTVELVKSVKERSQIHAFIEKIPFGMLSSSGNTFNFHVQMEMESKAGNRSSSEKINFAGMPEDKFRGYLVDELKKILAQKDWGSIQGSPSIREEAEILILDAVNGKKTNTKKPSTVAKKTKVRTVTKNVYRDKTPVNIEKKKRTTRDWLSMIQLINSRLAPIIISNMGAPGLVNRTGTFANSARVTGVQTTPQGYPSLGYTYNKAPYGVFDRRLGALPWATPERDPGLVIEKSIRELASSLAIGRFYLRRE